MKRLFIPDVSSVAEEYKQHIFESCGNKPVDKSLCPPYDNLIQLKIKMYSNRKVNPYFHDQVDYVDAIRENFDEILLLKPEDFGDYLINHPALFLTDSQLNDTLWGGTTNKEKFYEAIVEALRYEYVRNSPNGYVKYFPRLGINACVYCNASYIVNTNVEKLTPKGKTSLDVMGRYELDHFRPKSEYPFLCVSFYNLQPCCANCNRWKSVKKSVFNLYTEDPSLLNPFEFYLDHDVVVNLVMTSGVKIRNIRFRSKCASLMQNHEDVFHIHDLYKSFENETKELLWLKKAQSDGNKENVIRSFKSIFYNTQVARLLYGYHVDGDVHKRPLSKMKMDLAKQLGLKLK